MERYIISKEHLLFDLRIAYYKAIEHKSSEPYVIEFEKDLDKNLLELADELYNRTYKPEPSNCFIINHPKIREIFAANFRDRIVHHLYFYYLHELFENTFIQDSYSCIKNRGTHYGIERLEHHIREESHNFQEECYVLKMDIKGYFMNINRQLLCDIVIKVFDKMQHHFVSKDSKLKWCEVIDFEFVTYLTKEIALLDPSVNCIIKSPLSMWEGLSPSKSLLHTPNGCGLPIGNLTSQLFSNVFLNVLDQYMKRVLKCKHYGRYVDDFFVVSKDKEFIKSIIPKIEQFLKTELQLDINKGKTRILKVNQGVEYLGAFIKPFRNYISNQSLSRIYRQLFSEKGHRSVESINSFLGILSHYRSFNIRKEICEKLKLHEIGICDANYTKFKPFEAFKLSPLINILNE